MTYGLPPYEYRNARSIGMIYTISGEGLARFLPPGVELADPEPVVSAVFGSYPATTPFGAYSEFWFYVRATFQGKRFMFNPLMYVNSDSSMACGRELWGFPKKMAEIRMKQDGNRWNFNAQRPANELLVDVNFVVNGPGAPTLLDEVGFPTLTLRIIPNRSGRGSPDIAQLLSSFNAKHICRDAQGIEQRWMGDIQLTVGAGTVNDPVNLFKPVKILEAWMSIWDADLPEGEVIHDYNAS